MKKINKLLIIFLIFILGFALRSFLVGKSPLSGDESINIIRSIWIIKFFSQHNPYDLYGLVAHTHPPLELIAPIPFIFAGLTEYRARLAAILIGSLTPMIFVVLYRKWFSIKNLFLTAVIFAVSPFAIGWSRLAALPAFHMAYSLIILWALIRVYEDNSKKSLIILGILYGFSFWIMLDYVLLMPIVFWLIIRFIQKKGIISVFKPSIIFLLIFASYIIPYTFLGLKFAPKTLGINYNFNRNFHSAITSNIYYYTTSFILHWTVLPFLLAAIGYIFTKPSKKSKLWVMSILYIFSYLVFYLLIYGRHQAYLYGIYGPVIVVGYFAFVKIFKDKFSLLCIIFTIASMIMLSKFYTMGSSDTAAIWGFYKVEDLSSFAYKIRSCTPSNSEVLSDLDGYQTSLYFDRKYFPQQDTEGVQNAIKDKSLNPSAIFVNNRLTLSHHCDRQTGNFYKKYWDINSVVSFYR